MPDIFFWCPALRWLFAFGLLAVPMMSATAPGALAGDAAISLTELEPVSNWQESGALALDRSVGCTPLQIGGRTFERGLGTHARSEIVYELDGTVGRFEAWVGIDASKANSSVASVVFKVVVDGREVFDSGVMRGSTPAQKVSVDLAGVRELKLLVTDAGDGSKDDYANWADAVLIGAKPVSRRSTTAVARHEVQAPGLRIELSERGEIVGAKIGDGQASRAIRSGTSLDQCADTGPVTARSLANGGVEFTRQVVRKTTGQHARITERFRPTADSIRWEIEVESADPAWSTGIRTWLDWPETTRTTRYWTVWDDPEQRHDTWRDPLIPQPFATRRLWYGAAPWNGEERIGGASQSRGAVFRAAADPVGTGVGPWPQPRAVAGGHPARGGARYAPRWPLCLHARCPPAGRGAGGQVCHGPGARGGRLARRPWLDDAALRGVF
ncbi:MAG: NPCBM/NEW2 domain-containing protein [Opitutaceae bacterium]|nr:NPCBM/NEW2 domain-containing protein [Opitutaceae bacterium]